MAAIASFPFKGQALITGAHLDTLVSRINAISTQTIIIPIQLVGLVNAAVWKIAVPFAFSLNSVGFRTGTVVSTAAKAATLTAQIAGVALGAGGVLGLTSANQAATGTLLAGSAITGANTGIAGATLEAVVSSVTTFAEGSGWIEFNITATG